MVAGIPGLWQLALVLWASSGHLCFMHTLKEATGDPAQSHWHRTRMTNPGFGNKKGCLQPVSLLNKSEKKPWVFFLRHFCIFCLSVLASYFDLRLQCGHISVQGRSCVTQMIIFTLFNVVKRMLFSPLFFFRKAVKWSHLRLI